MTATRNRSGKGPRGSGGTRVMLAKSPGPTVSEATSSPVSQSSTSAARSSCVRRFANQNKLNSSSEPVIWVSACIKRQQSAGDCSQSGTGGIGTNCGIPDREGRAPGRSLDRGAEATGLFSDAINATPANAIAHRANLIKLSLWRESSDVKGI